VLVPIVMGLGTSDKFGSTKSGREPSEATNDIISSINRNAFRRLSSLRCGMLSRHGLLLCCAPFAARSSGLSPSTSPVAWLLGATNKRLNIAIQHPRCHTAASSQQQQLKYEVVGRRLSVLVCVPDISNSSGTGFTTDVLPKHPRGCHWNTRQRCNAQSGCHQVLQQ